jgi:hypothetical protein
MVKFRNYKLPIVYFTNHKHGLFDELPVIYNLLSEKKNHDLCNELKAVHGLFCELQAE